MKGDGTKAGESEQDRTTKDNWELIQDSLQHLNEGISVFNGDLELVLFNRKFVETLNFPDDLVRIGVSIAELFRFNASRGEYGPGDPDEQVRQRLELARRFEAHSFERTRPDGAVIEVRGNPLPGGGFVTIYADITVRKRLENRLHEMASTDELTGVCNRRRFFDLASIEISRSRRYDCPVSFLMMDADRFKSINDNFGHVTGDRVLKALADTARASLRTVDILARYGGEEFAILLPETDEDNAVSVAERLRLAISETEVPTERGPLYFTASLGVAGARGAAIDLGRLIDRADQALFAAKHSGRNLVMRAE